jgi:hypothetical protein
MPPLFAAALVLGVAALRARLVAGGAVALFAAASSSFIEIATEGLVIHISRNA